MRLDSGAATQGRQVLRQAIARLGLGGLLWSLLPCTPPRHQGVPRSASGLRLDAEGWVHGQGRVSWTPLLAIVLFATVLRLVRLDADLWLDEIVTVVTYMRIPIAQSLQTFGAANQHLLNSVLGHAALTLLGESAWSVRLPAVLFGIGGVGALYYVGRAVTSEREALVASALLALSYHHVWFSQNARGYTGMVCFGLLGTGLFLRGLGANRGRDWILYALVLPLGAASLLNSVFVFASHVPAYGLALWGWGDGRRHHGALTARVLGASLLGALLTLVAYSLMLPAMADYFIGGRARPGWTNPLAFLEVVVDGLVAGFGSAGIPALAAGLGVAMVGLWSYWKQSPLVVALLSLPVFFNLSVLLVLSMGAYPRSFLYVLPAGLLLIVRGTTVVGAGLSRVLRSGERDQSRTGETVLVALLVIASAYALSYNYRYPKQDYRGALDYVMDYKAPQDIVGAVGWAATSYRFYYGPALEFPQSVADLRALQNEGRPVWVLYSFTRDMNRLWPDLYRYLREEYEPVASFRGTLPDGTVYVVRHSAANGGGASPAVGR